ncbi:MAG: hypothetical protein H7Z14_22320 [Anaerolineae bacterium]|nr:hypothetical protein [Phycisphaerae bacterium]
MSRKARALAKRSLHAAVRHCAPIESLEKRQLLTTMVGPGDGQSSFEEFLDGDQNTIRVSLRGNITVELIGLWVAATDNDLPLSETSNILTDMVKPMQQNPLAAPNTFLPGAYLYSIYIAQADINSSISIAQVPAQTTGGGNPDRPMMPFGGAAGSFNIVNADTGDDDTVTPASASGAVLFGARTGDTIDAITEEEDIAIISQPLKKNFGVRPRTPKGKLDAGLSTAPGVDVGQILLGGTIIGRVNITGSCNLFYAGQIWTGDARGIDYLSAPTVPRNFEVGGDLRNLVTIGSIGTDAIDDSDLEKVDFKTGFDLRVRGRLGQVMTKDSFLGEATVTADPNFIGPGTAIPEVEVRGTPRENSQSFFEGDEFSSDPRQAAPSLGDNPIFNNDTLATAQYIGTARSSTFGGRVLAEVSGGLNGNDDVDDDVDYYAMGLLAGQNVQIQLTGLLANVGVYDPDGRIIASDYSNNDLETTTGAPFRFTADRPGVYKFAIANSGDINFNGVLDGGESVSSIGGPNPYVLTIDRVADVTLGGIVASSNIGTTDFLNPDDFFAGSFASFTVANGDLGALVTTGTGGGGGGGGGSVGGTIFSGAMPYTVTRGNLRAIESDSIGILRNNEPVFAPDLRVPKGTVGLLRARGTDNATQVLAVNLSFVTPFAGTFNTANSIGFDYQLVDAGAIFAGNLLADRGIGTVRADLISTVNFAPRIAANADNIGNDGFVDLIDARTSLGTLEAGGPAITTGTGGNVKYIRSQGATFRDRFFGGGSLDFTRISPGVPFRYTDDSGTSVKLTPTPIIPNGQDDFNEVGLTVQTYGIRDKGGSVLTFVAINAVRTVNGVEQASGILIDTGNVKSGGAEIGVIAINNTGSPVTFITQSLDVNGNPISARDFVTTSTTSQLSTLEMKGRAPISVFSVDGTNINSLNNRTSGEIVNITAQSAGVIQGNNLGVAMSKTGAKIEGVDVVRDVFPFKGQRTLINVAGPIQVIRARGALGNVFSSSTIGEATANSDGADDTSIIEGIVAPISTTNSILNVNIGELLAPSGSGEFALSGLYAGGVIASIRNQGLNSDICGDIVASQNSILPGANGLPGVAGIGEIKLINGSIIDADIMVARLTDTLELPRAFVFPGSTSFFFPAIIPNIGDITLEGNGGIIGALIGGDSIGNVGIKGGFGTIDSEFLLNGSGTFGGIDTDGYGIRLTDVDGGATVDHLVARGTGKIIDTRSYSITVRQSESLTFDPFSGRQLARYNDLHKFLGTTGTNPKNKDTSTAGTIEDSTITGSRDLNTLSAYRIFGRPGVLDPLTDRPAMRISFAENIGKMITSENIDGLDLTAGTISLLQSGKDIQNTTVSVSGLLKQLVAGNIKGSTQIDVQGGEGRIGSITTKRALFGRISAATKIDSILVGTDLGSPSLSSSNDIGTVTINGNILSGALLRAADQIATLIVHGNVNEGATVRAKRIGTQTIDGSVSGDIVIG